MVLKLRHTLMGKALAVLLGVFAICCAVVFIGALFKHDLDEQRRQLVQMSERELEVQFQLLVATDLLADLTKPHGGGGPDDAVVLGWEAHLRSLVGTEPVEGPSARRGVALQRALAEVREVLAEPRPVEDVDEVVSRLKPVLQQLATRARARLSELQKARIALSQEYEREADADALWMLAIGLGGFITVSLLTGRFLLRLARDLQRLEHRAAEISTGDYGEPMGFDRRDEVGELGKAVNTMADALAKREEGAEASLSHLFESERMFALGTFAAGIAHELGNPIHAMSALVERIGASRSEEDSERRMADNLDRMQLISEQIERMNRVIHEVGEFARTGPAQAEPTSINQAIDSAIRMSRFHPGFREVELTADLSRDLPMVQAVPEHLTQLALNILVNASDAVEPGSGKITVTTTHDEEAAIITIADNGRGMSQETAESALDPFFTTKSRGGGSGLGLAVCQAIVDQHGGSLEIETAPGLGTTICVRIPLGKDGESR